MLFKLFIKGANFFINPKLGISLDNSIYQRSNYLFDNPGTEDALLSV